MRGSQTHLASRTGTVLVLLVMSLGIAGLAAAAPSSNSSSCGGKITRQGMWLRVAAPKFTDGAQTISAYAIDSANPAIAMVTNGVVIERSADYGCTWTNVFTVPTVPSASFPFSAQTASITAIATGSSGHDYAVVDDSAHPHVIASADGGKTWAEADTGIVAPTTGKSQLAVAGTSVAYLLVRTAGQLSAPADLIYATADGGKTWTPNAFPVSTLLRGPGSAPVVRSIAVEPANTKALWVATDSGLYHSTDSGATWSTPDIGGSDSMGAVAIYQSPNGKAAVSTFEDAQSLAYYSTDSGSSWSPSPTPSTVASAAVIHGTPDIGIATSGGSVYRFDPAKATWKQIWNGKPALKSLSPIVSPAAYLAACTCNATVADSALWVYAAGQSLSSLPSFKQPLPLPANSGGECLPITPPAPTPKTWAPSTLTPTGQRIALANGQKQTVHYQLHVMPRQMAVFYLEDNGTKSEFSQCPFDVGALIATTALAQARNYAPGLGTFGDYTTSENVTISTTGTSLYYRYVDIDPSLKAFFQHASNLGGGWGAGTENHTSGDRGDLGAMVQAAAGQGQDLAPPGHSAGDVPGGMQASWGPDAYRVIMHVAADYFNDPSRSPGYPGPTFAAARDLLRRLEIHQAGIWVDNSQNKENNGGESYDGRVDLTTMARNTDAVSSKNVDCQSQGAVDVHVGDPLVCTFFASAEDIGKISTDRDPMMGFEMSKLLLAMRDPEPVRLAASTSPDNVAGITPGVYKDVDYLVPQDRGFDVTFSCNSTDLGASHDVTLDAHVGRWIVASAKTTVVCGSPPLHQLGPVAFLPPLPPPPVTVPNPGPAPNLGPNIAPNPAPNPQQVPQANPQGVPQGVAMVQQQEQPQLAFQQARNDAMPEEQAMSAYQPRGRDPYGHLRWAGGGVAFCLMAGYALVQMVSRKEQAFARTRRRTT
jgi:photosystem II stability/assembly factor-like uncharacterized protein